MTEIEKLRVQIETLKGIEQTLERWGMKQTPEWSFHGKFNALPPQQRAANEIGYKLASCRFRLKQLSRQATGQSEPEKIVA